MINKWQILKGTLIFKVVCKKILLYFWNRFLEILVRQSTLSTVSLSWIDYLGKTPVFIDFRKWMIAKITDKKWLGERERKRKELINASLFYNDSVYILKYLNICKIHTMSEEKCYRAKTAHPSEIFIRAMYLKCSNLKNETQSSPTCNSWLINSNGMANCLGLFYTKRLLNHIHCTFFPTLTKSGGT